MAVFVKVSPVLLLIILYVTQLLLLIRLYVTQAQTDFTFFPTVIDILNVGSA